jgi:hypothetical protein
VEQGPCEVRRDERPRPAESVWLIRIGLGLAMRWIQSRVEVEVALAAGVAVGMHRADLPACLHRTTPDPPPQAKPVTRGMRARDAHKDDDNDAEQRDAHKRARSDQE